MKLYLCGPMRGLPQFNFPAFFEAADKLRQQGHEVINPAEMDIEQDQTDYRSLQPVDTKHYPKPFSHYMKRDLPAICDCEGLALLPGWEDSKGCRMEIFLALECGLPIFAADDITTPIELKCELAFFE